MQKKTYGEDYEIINEFKKFFRSRIRDVSYKNKLAYLIIYGFFMDAIQKYFKYDLYKKDKNKFSFLQTILLDNQPTEEIATQIIEFLVKEEKQLSEEKEKEKSIFYNYDYRHTLKYTRENILNQQIVFLQNLKKSLNDYLFDYNSEGSRDKSFEHFIFDYDPHKNNSFLNQMVDLFEDNNIFDINWLGISSGHKAYLNMFASLYQELRYTKSSNLLLCIDEGDLYLHPKWQIEFFDKLLKILPQIYNGNIQLVLTSHSPFLLSDLPNNNIIILDNGKSIHGKDLNIKTFGGNLYNLYAEAFFLNEKRTSEFAFNKIKDLIEKVKSKNLTQEDKNEILAINSIIGDEIIQYQINRALNND